MPQLPQFAELPQALVTVPQLSIPHLGVGQTHWLLLSQFSPAPQLPQFVELPQAFVTVPHTAFPQDAAGQTHWLFPLQTSPVPHPPQFAEFPHAFESVPQALPQLMGWQTQALLLHDSSVPQPPQDTVRVAPQLSAAVSDPQVAPSLAQNCASVSGLQTQVLFEQLSEPAHEPQLFVCPQALETGPHSTPEQEGVGHSQVLLLEHVRSLEQEPQFAVRGSPQLSVPVTSPHVFPNLAQNCVFDSD